MRQPERPLEFLQRSSTKYNQGELTIGYGDGKGDKKQHGEKKRGKEKNLEQELKEIAVCISQEEGKSKTRGGFLGTTLR